MAKKTVCKRVYADDRMVRMTTTLSNYEEPAMKIMMKLNATITQRTSSTRFMRCSVSQAKDTYPAKIELRLPDNNQTDKYGT